MLRWRQVLWDCLLTTFDDIGWYINFMMLHCLCSIWYTFQSNFRVKEDTQEHSFSAWGLDVMQKEFLMSSSLKSTVDPLINWREVSSTTTLEPFFSNTLSSSWSFESRWNLYWKPEQPPPSTSILKNSSIEATLTILSAQDFVIASPDDWSWDNSLDNNLIFVTDDRRFRLIFFKLYSKTDIIAGKRVMESTTKSCVFLETTAPPRVSHSKYLI